MGRERPAGDPLQSEVTVKWTTNSYDENAIGELEDVGFEATSSSTASAPSNCNPGRAARAASTTTAWASSQNKHPGLSSRATTTEDKYKPNSRCGWRIEATKYVELEFTELAIENGFDFVKIYAGGTAPTGFSLTDPATEPKLLYAATGSTLPTTLLFEGDVFVTFESDGLGNTAVGAADNGGFELEYRSLPTSSTIKDNCDGDWTSPIKNCALDHCTGTQERDGVHGHGSFSSSSGKSAADATDYPAMTTCRWEFEVSPGFTGLSFKALVWDVEASGALTSTTDAVKIYNNDEDGTLVGTLKGGDDPAEWEFEYTATSGKFVAVFESDLNNPVPKKGFDLMYAGMYGTSAGMLGGFCSGDWPCVEGECDGGTCKTPSKKGSNEIPGYVIAMIVVMCVLLLGLAVFLYFYRKKMKAKTHWLISTAKSKKAIISEQQEELQNFRDSVVGMRAVVKAAAPWGGGGGGGRAGPPAAPARWYWEGEPGAPGGPPRRQAAALDPLRRRHLRAPREGLRRAPGQDPAHGGVRGRRRAHAPDELKDGLQPQVVAGRAAGGPRGAAGVARRRAGRGPPLGHRRRRALHGAPRREHRADRPGARRRLGLRVPHDAGGRRADGRAAGRLVAEPGLVRDGEHGGALGGPARRAPEGPRGQRQRASALDPPAYWDEVKDPLMAQLFRLDPRDAKTRTSTTAS